MGDDITIGVTEIVNNIEVTAQPNDQVIDIEVIDNSDDVTLNVTPNVIEVNINKGSSYARWGSIFGNLTDQADLTSALFNKADLVDGKVPSYQLPSFVDDVIEVANYAALPTVGEIGKIYITLDDNKIYRWSGSIYIEIASNQAIWGAITGSLTNQTDLVNALNLKADKSTTLTINGTTFDLSANRTYTIPTHDAVTLGTANGLSLSGQVLSLALSGASSTGALSSTDWNTFNNKLSSLSGAVLTTTDQSVSGVKTFTNLAKFTNNTGSFAVEIDTTSSDALVIKNAGTTTLQIGKNGEIIAAKYKISGGFSSQFLKANGDLDSTVYTPASRTITINGVTQDLTANRSFTVATHDAVTIGTANGLSLSGQALSLGLSSGSTTGSLSSTDWTTFNNKQNALNGTGFVKISGTTISYDNNTYALDSAVVTLATDQTISGQKTFLNNVNIDAGINLDDAFGLYWKTNVGAIETALAGIGQSSSGLNFFTGSSLSTPKMVITSGGNVGIGTTTNAEYKLDVNGTGRFVASANTYAGGSLILRSFTGGTNIFLTSVGTNFALSNGGSADHLIIANSGAATFSSSVTASGFIANGNSAGGFEGLRIVNASTGAAQIVLNNSAQSWLLNTRTDNHFSIFNATASTTPFFINTSGNVGIGTQSPSSKLTISSPDTADSWNSTNPLVTISNLDQNGNEGNALLVRGGAQSTNSYIINAQDYSGNSKFYIRGDGNVGIGTTSPTSKLDVRGDGHFGNGSSSYNINIGSDSNYAYLRSDNAALGFLFGTRNSVPLIFNTTDTEQMRITSNGNINFNATVYNNTAVATTRTLYIGSDYRIGGISSIRKSKKNIENVSNVDWIYQLNPVTFNYRKKDEEGEYTEETYDELVYGLIAEDTETIADFLVNYNENDGEKEMIGIEYSRLITPMLKAIQELKAEIELLKQK
jgi:hypothetical protein